MDSKLLISFHAMPKAEMVRYAYYVRKILTDILARPGVERDERRLVMHADNARPYTAK
jgi:hypothetical protein